MFSVLGVDTTTWGLQKLPGYQERQLFLWSLLSIKTSRPEIRLHVTVEGVEMTLRGGKESSEKFPAADVCRYQPPKFLFTL